MFSSISPLQKGHVTAATQRSQRRLPYRVTRIYASPCIHHGSFLTLCAPGVSAVRRAARHESAAKRACHRSDAAFAAAASVSRHAHICFAVHPSWFVFIAVLRYVEPCPGLPCCTRRPLLERSIVVRLRRAKALAEVGQALRAGSTQVPLAMARIPETPAPQGLPCAQGGLEPARTASRPTTDDVGLLLL